MSKNLVGLMVSAGVVVAAPLLGVATTAFLLRGAFQGTATAVPSEKADLLSEGIAVSMGATAFGVMVSLIAILPVIIFAVRLRNESKRRAPPS